MRHLRLDKSVKATFRLHAFIMDPEKKGQTIKRRLVELFRRLFYPAVVIFLLSCIAFLVLNHLEMKQNLATMDEKVNAIELTVEKLATSPPHNKAGEKNRLDTGSLPVRRSKRAATVSLQNLDKRVKVLEIR